MKQFVAHIVLLVCISANSCYGQCPSNKGQLDISISYGLISSDQVTDQLTTQDISGGIKTRTYVSGASFASVRYFLFNRLAMGISVGVTNERGQYTGRTTPTIITSTYDLSTTTVAMEFYYVYTFKKYLEVYTLIGIGPAFATTQTTTYTAPNSAVPSTSVAENKLKAQYSPIGLRFGGRLAGFVELGLGYKGVINGGISYKFGRSCWWKGH